jgi:large subunit ribosomal protein L5
MWEFFDKLVSITLPRVKDFQGVKRSHIDSVGNYNLGISEQIVFPEINYDQVAKMTGLQITIVNKADSKEEALKLLELLGMPFEKEENK